MEGCKCPMCNRSPEWLEFIKKQIQISQADFDAENAYRMGMITEEKYKEWIEWNHRDDKESPRRILNPWEHKEK